MSSNTEVKLTAEKIYKKKYNNNISNRMSATI